MEALKIIEGKKVLIVDDESDVLDTLSELLDRCLVDKASDFESAEKLLNTNTYDAAILDIMGVRGYDLLEISKQKSIPALIITAHAISSDDFKKSLEGGAEAYIPKEKLSEIAEYLADLFHSLQEGKKPNKWLSRLKLFFDIRLGYEWQDKHKDLLDKFDWMRDSE